MVCYTQSITLVMLQMCVCVGYKYLYTCICVCVCACMRVRMCACFHNISAVQNYHKTLKPAIGTCNVAVKNSSVYRKDSSQHDVRLQSHLVTQ